MNPEIVCKYRNLRFIVPSRTECFWPYYGICFIGEYDQILENITSEDIVLDAGANIGIFTLLAGKKAKKVIAVEPDQENYEYFVKNIRLNVMGNIIAINKALSDYIGSGYIFGKGPLKALSHTGTRVSVTTIDSLLRDLSLERIDVVKMDIEGSEVKALNGEYLSKVRELMVEVHNKDGYEIVRKILGKNGFEAKEWKLSYTKVMKRVLQNLGDFLNAEFKTDFLSSKLILRYIVGASKHPVPAADKESSMRLIYATRAHS
ncbi:MAG: hypothetical protein C4294_18185 [Nitrospiraceae bacterium]